VEPPTGTKGLDLLSRVETPTGTKLKHLGQKAHVPPLAWLAVGPGTKAGKPIDLSQDFLIDIFQCLRSVPTKINECDETTRVAGSVPGTDGSRAEDASGIK